jgi:hypothetical protein
MAVVADEISPCARNDKDRVDVRGVMLSFFVFPQFCEDIEVF